MLSVRFQGKPFNIMVIQVYDPTSNTEEAEVERFYEDLQDLLELTPKKDILFIIGDWNTKVGSQETPGLTGKNQMVNTEIRLIIFYAAKDGEALYSQQKHELLTAKFRLKLKKVEETTRPFRYVLNQIPYDYIVEVANRFRGFNLIDRVPEEL